MTEQFDDYDYKLMLNSLVGALENVGKSETLEDAKKAAHVGLVTYPVHEGFGRYIHTQLKDKDAELAALRERVAELENIAKIFRKVLAEEYIELCYFGKNERATRDWIDRVITPAEGGE